MATEISTHVVSSVLPDWVYSVFCDRSVTPHRYDVRVDRYDLFVHVYAGILSSGMRISVGASQALAYWCVLKYSEEFKPTLPDYFVCKCGAMHDLYSGFGIKNGRYKCTTCVRRDSLRTYISTRVDIEKEARRVHNHNKRTRDLGLGCNLKTEQWLGILLEHDFSCAYCRGPFEELDHIVPVAKGGSTTAKNVLPSCKACNMKKGDR